MRLVFNEKQKRRSLDNYGGNSIIRYSWQRFDGNVDVVTWIQVPRARPRSVLLMRFPVQRTADGPASMALEKSHLSG
jgi:hypothetical protein